MSSAIKIKIKKNFKTKQKKPHRKQNPKAKTTKSLEFLLLRGKQADSSYRDERITEFKGRTQPQDTEPDSLHVGRSCEKWRVKQLLEDTFGV